MACATVGHMDGNPCPNPTCTYIFPSAAVVGAASLTCPRCGGVFRFRHSPPDAGKAPARPAPGDGPSRSPLFSESSDDVSAHDSGPGLPEDLLSLPGPRRRMPQPARRGGWLALAAQDYKRRTPGDSEVIEEAVRRLRNHFKQSLEYESAGNDELADRPAQRIVFQGTADNVLISGECYILKHGGMVYWFTTWARSTDAPRLRSEFAKLRCGFGVLHE